MGRIGPLHTGQDAMSKILASKDQELEKNRKALTRLVVLGGAVTLAPATLGGLRVELCLPAASEAEGSAD